MKVINDEENSQKNLERRRIHQRILQNYSIKGKVVVVTWSDENESSKSSEDDEEGEAQFG